MDWDDREDKLDERVGQNKVRHSMECPHCRSRTWSFLRFQSDFGKGKIIEGCDECDEDAKRMWDRERKAGSASTGMIALGVCFVVGLLAGWFLIP